MKIYFLCLFLLPFGLVAQNSDSYEIRIKKSADKIKLDGLLDENAWKIAEVAENFYLNRPYDSSFAKEQTHIRLTFDDDFLYVAGVVDQKKETYTVLSLKRDFEGRTGDVLFMNFDTFKDKLNAFHFALSPYGIQREGLISLGDIRDNTWDNKWYSIVKNYDDHWDFEMAIPFKTLRYKVVEGENSWLMNFGRAGMQSNEGSNWVPVPRNFKGTNLAFSGKLIWEDAPPKPGVNISLIPFITVGLQSDFPRDVETLASLDKTSGKTTGVGIDAKVAITPSLNLDITVNPDFSQVEVDQQQTNISRFELFFPEKRQFFIENSDLFGTFGFPNTRPFFSRRIGITQNPTTGFATAVPIKFGARLSGKLNENWRIGAMNMQTGSVDFDQENSLPAANYSLLIAQRKLFKRSTIGAIFVNKDNNLSTLNDSKKPDFNDFNRVAGLEFNYFSADNRVEIETYFHRSFTPNLNQDATSMAHFMAYHHPHIDLNLGTTRVGANFVAESGFVPRTGIISLYRPEKLIFNPKNESISKRINAYGIGTEGNDNFDLKGKLLDSETAFFTWFTTPAQAEFSAGYYFNYTYLFEPFDPTNASVNPNPDLWKNTVPLPVGDYRSKGFFMAFSTAAKNKFIFTTDSYIGSYFNGKGYLSNGSLAYRLQPLGLISIDYDYTKIALPQPYNTAAYWLIGPKAELSFSKSVFLSTFFQYNTQANNTNINTRLQWRFKPVSDLFLVYTDNYFAQEIGKYRISPWMPKNRALILKITYWLNV